MITVTNKYEVPPWNRQKPNIMKHDNFIRLFFNYYYYICQSTFIKWHCLTFMLQNQVYAIKCCEKAIILLKMIKAHIPQQG